MELFFIYWLIHKRVNKEDLVYHKKIGLLSLGDYAKVKTLVLVIKYLWPLPVVHILLINKYIYIFI